MSVSNMYAFKFARLLSTPFEEWDAYQMGLIDEEGNIVREPDSSKEKKELDAFTRLVINIKRRANDSNEFDDVTDNFSNALEMLESEGYGDVVGVIEEEDLFEVGASAVAAGGGTQTTDVPTDANIGPKPDGQVMGNPFFDIGKHAFYDAYKGKKKKQHWRKFVQNDENYENLRQYANKYPKSPIYIRNRETQSQFIRVR